MTLLVASMSSPPHSSLLNATEHDSPPTSGFNTPNSLSSGQHTPAAGYRTAAGTLSNVFASLWGTYDNQQQQRESGLSRLQPPKSTQAANDPPSPSIPSGWGNLLSWGPAAGRQSTSTSTPRKSASPARASGQGKPGRSRGAIPFNISGPLEAEKVDFDRGEGSSFQAVERTQRRSETLGDANLSPTSSPRRRPLAGIFEDLVTASPPQTPASRSPASPRNQHRALPPASPSTKDESPRGAYATLSRLQSKPSNSKLRSGSGFLWPPSPAGGSEQTTSPAMQHRPAANWSEAIARAEKLDSYVRRIVFQAGLDYETRPMVVLAACCLPDPKEVDYDALLDRIMDTMDLFVENDYTVIYFAGGGHHRPGWNWIWRAYRRLDRRFRKNLKKLYIVHPTFFTRSLLQFVNTGAYFVSPKFSKKVSQLYTLSALAEHVPLTQIDIPPEVLQWNTRYEKHVNLPARSTDVASEGSADKVFGIDLVQLMGEYGESGGVPRVVRDCVEAILGDFDGIRPAEVEGIFRRSPSSALLKTAQESYDRGHPVSLEQYRDPHIPAVLLKVFLRSLPRPIFPASLYGLIRACPSPPLPSSDADGAMLQAQAQETIEYLRTRLLPAIEPACCGILLSYVLEMLHKVAQHHDTNKMDAANLATVIAPNLVSSGNAMKDMLICRVEGIGSMTQQPPKPQHSRKASLNSTTDSVTGGNNTTLGTILRFCIERYYEIFDEISFAAQINSVQDLVDDLGREGEQHSRSPSVASRGLPSLYDTPASTVARHRRGESTNSSVSGFSQPSSPWATANPNASHGTTDTEEDEDRRSGLTGRSMASRDGYRAPAGLHRGTIGRNSSGSLRLTKGRLGSNNNLRASFTACNPAVSGSASGLTRPSGLSASAAPSSGSAADTEGLVSQLSVVTLTGANAIATFSSPMADRGHSALNAAQQDKSESEPRSSLTPSSASASASSNSSPILTSKEQGAAVVGLPAPQQGLVTGQTGVGRRKSVRRELSEVAEAEDDDDHEGHSQ